MCSSEECAALESRLKEAEAQLAADKLALQLAQQRVQVAEEKAAAALAAAQEQAARADSERAWVRQQQEGLTPRLESTSALQAEAKQRARELSQQAEELQCQRQQLDAERGSLEKLRQQLEASQAQADRTLAQAAEVAAREQQLAAKERAVVEQEAALRTREAQVAQVGATGSCSRALQGHAGGRLLRRRHGAVQLRRYCPGRLGPSILILLPALQAEAAAASDQQRLGGLSRELESRAAADGDALRRLQETLAAQQEDLQQWVGGCLRLSPGWPPSVDTGRAAWLAGCLAG